ncbi:hypothetical protein NRS6084_00907 [Bacillus subtilis]|nr:hypothetical protein NRS6084_00907 [Bacillus subtilis]
MSKDTNSLAHTTWNCKAVHDAVGCWGNKLPISIPLKQKQFRMTVNGQECVKWKPFL